jgi:hypothetical protein
LPVCVGHQTIQRTGSASPPTLLLGQHFIQLHDQHDPHTVERFVKRMNGLAETTLHSFFETPLGAAVHVFGNVAVAAAGCEVTENGTKVNRGVEMMLLMKDQCGWRIVAQAWDTEKSAGLHIPHELAERHHDKRADAPVPFVPRHDSHA